MIAAGASWPITEVVQDGTALPDGWPVTAAGSALVTGVCLAWMVVLRALGRWRWRKTGGRAYNAPEPVRAVAARNSAQLADLKADHAELKADNAKLKRSLDEILDVMAETSGVSPTAKTVPQLRLVRGERRDAS